MNACLRLLRHYWTTLLIVLAPLVLLPLPLVSGTSEAKCGYVVLLMAIFWMTEAIPLPVTAMFPVFMFPLFGILDVRKLCANYMSDSNFLYIGGIMVALAVEECNLHKRLALSVLLKVGSQPKYLMLGFMLATGFLSMWLNNTATVAMMLPTAIVITEELIRERQSHRAPLKHAGLMALTPLGLVLSSQSFAQRKGGLTLPNVDAEAGEMRQRQSTDLSQTSRRSSCCSASSDPECLTHASTSTQTDSYLSTASASAPEKPATGRIVAPAPLLKLTKAERRLSNGMLLCICYAANIGGSATLTGTGPNLVFIGQLERIFKGADTGINYLSWIEFALPSVLVTLLISWLWMVLMFTCDWSSIKSSCFACIPRGKQKIVPVSKANSFVSNNNNNNNGPANEDKQNNIKRKNDDAIKAVLQRQFNELGPLTFAEVMVGILFLALIGLWITRHPGFVPGWDVGFRQGYLTDTCAVILITCLLFILPKDRPTLANFISVAKGEKVERKKNGSTLLTWKVIENKFPWGVIVLIGGGFAMADGITASHLSNAIGESLHATLGQLTPLAVCTITILIIAIFTETASNTSTANIMLPVVISLAQSLCVNPLYFALPVTIACCFSFMLPASNPSNAIIFGTGRVKIFDMITGGMPLNVISIIVLIVNINTWGTWLFSLERFPDWAYAKPVDGANITLCL